MNSQQGPKLPYSVVAGVVPTKLGWLVSSAKLRGATFAPEEAQACTSFRNVLEVRPTFTIVVVNAPVGYLDDDTQGQRVCDQEARSLLGDDSSVILNAPTRDVLSRDEYSSPAHDDFLFDRYREVAREVAPSNQRVVYESNPELSFYQLNGFELLASAVASVDGHAERRALLELKIPGIERVLDSELPEVTSRELRDAVALMWTARRVFGHSATRLPHDGVWDSAGLRMEMVF